MEAPKLPAVRLPPVNVEGNASPNGAVLGVRPTNKFSVSWPSDARTGVSTPSFSERRSLTSAEGKTNTDPDSERKDSAQHEVFHTTPIPYKSQPPESTKSSPIPRFSRALSMPLPSQLGYLRNPHRSDPTTPAGPNLSSCTTPVPARVCELSVELADAVQMMIQTMLQISPPHVLDPAKEQFSACAVSVPTSSISALFTAMKNLNFISANMSDLCSEPLLPTGKGGLDMAEPPPGQKGWVDFDIGEMLQSVGDSLSGAAAQAGVDLVLYHGDDIGLRHVCVKGDESGISYVLSHVSLSAPRLLSVT